MDQIRDNPKPVQQSRWRMPITPWSWRRWAWCIIAAFFCSDASKADDNLQPYQIAVGDLNRVALVHLPNHATKRPAPVVFVFHGQGGQMLDGVHDFPIHNKWPEAIVAYMQGMPKVSRNDPEGKLTDWQRKAGDLDDRDLRYFDAVLSDFQKSLKVDNERIFVVGHSNGGAFAYLLWSQRSEQLAGIVSCGMLTDRAMVSTFKPKPLLQIAGRRDPIAKLAQQELMVEAVRQLNKCDEGRPWFRKGCTLYPSEIGGPVVFFVHPGGHEMPKEAPAVIVEFFKKEATPKSTSQPKNP